jgi:hypothetical protein
MGDEVPCEDDFVGNALLHLGNNCLNGAQIIVFTQ